MIDASLVQSMVEYPDSGVDLNAIRAMLKLTPSERLEHLQQAANQIWASLSDEQIKHVMSCADISEAVRDEMRKTRASGGSGRTVG